MYPQDVPISTFNSYKPEFIRISIAILFIDSRQTLKRHVPILNIVVQGMYH